MQLEGLITALNDLPAYHDLVARLRAGDTTSDQHILRAARPFVSAALARDLGRPTVIVTARVERAHNIAEQLPVWLPNTPILRFTEPGSLFYERSPWTIQTIRGRLDVMSKLAPPITASGGENTKEPAPIIVTSALALMQRTLPMRDFRASSRLLKVDQQNDPDKLLRHWLTIGYSPTSIVVEPGTFSRRGGIVDIFPINQERPLRIEFFGDTIDSMRFFDPSSQRSSEAIRQVAISPAREALPKLGPDVAKHLYDWFESQPEPEQDVTSARRDRGDLESGTAFPLIEFYLPCFYNNSASLLDYLPNNALVIVEDWSALSDSIADLEHQSIEQREEKLRDNQLPNDFPLPYFTWDELHEALIECKPIHLGNSPLDEEQPLRENEMRLGDWFAPGAHYGGQLRRVLESLQSTVKAGERVVVVSNQSMRLAELWDEQTRETTQLIDNVTNVPDGVAFVEGTLTEGWSLKGEEQQEQPMLHLLTDAEIFGWKRPEPRRHRTIRPVSNQAYFADLEPGDYVVHVEYGIGKFVGLRKRTLDGNEREYLVIQFAGSDMLYVPIHQADRLSRYVGADDSEPTLNRIGSNEWHKTKEVAQAAAEEVARELLDLYAKRQSLPGYAFNPDTVWQHELEASFPYIETEDQLRALTEVKADMERSTPMDRLICGDVGYGKTEVALRAAFKATMDGKQVAVLVPTTVLAQQHYTTFSQRLAAFPVQVEMLSRFRTHQEQIKILERVARGEIDILIGTHRLLQHDVIFKDLGLLVIDEEQRFGVTHKERLKQMRTEVDVLTLTATPIPRTLYMSLSGIRDISMIQTPPEERLPVLTHVGPTDEKLIHQAILRELDRGGQVFYLHNRVSTIDGVRERLEALVPEAKIVIGHGQMAEEELERVMNDFAAGEYDVLLCTTIIESGLDIQNANTIIIDRADLFGLAQLYQLRGRVGRSANRAYAYLFHPKSSRLTEEARARLDTIAEQTELGSGLNIAMRDLEIRGSGDLLGTRQSGYIASVGFYLYTQLLAQAVQYLKTAQGLQTNPSGMQALLPELPVAVPTITIDLPIPTYIPTDFIKEMPLRLQLYRRLADLQTEQAVDDMYTELLDRFGKLPDEILGLLFQIKVKLRAQKAHVTSITVEDDQVNIRLPYLASIDRRTLQAHLGHGVRVSRTSVWLPCSENADEWQTHLLDVLGRLQASAAASLKTDAA